MRSFLACLGCVIVVSMSSGQEISEPPHTVKVPALVMAARLLTTVTPKFPKKPMAKCSDRMVTLDAIIGDDGKVKSVKVLSGFEEFQESAMEAVKQWTYKPYLENGSPASVETEIGVFYPSDGTPGPFFVPDGKGGAKIVEPPCGPKFVVKPAPAQ